MVERKSSVAASEKSEALGDSSRAEIGAAGEDEAGWGFAVGVGVEEGDSVQSLLNQHP